MIDIAFSKPAMPRSGALALLIPEGGVLSGLAAELDRALGKSLTRALEVSSFKGEHCQTVVMPGPSNGLSRIVVVGLGSLKEINAHRVEEAGAAAAAALGGDQHAYLAADGLGAVLLTHAGVGARLRSYRFDRYRTRDPEIKKPKLQRITILRGPSDSGDIEMRPREVRFFCVDEALQELSGRYGASPPPAADVLDIGDVAIK